METLLSIRGAIARFYKQYNLSINMIGKAIGYFLLFHYVANIEGFSAGLSFNSLPVQVILAVLSSILPSRIGIFLAILLGLLNVWQISQIGTAVAALLFLCVYIMTSRMFPDHVYMLVLVPVALHFKVYLLLPVLAGLYSGVIAIVPMILGVIFYLMLEQLPTMMALAMPEEMGELPNLLSDMFSTLFDQILSNDILIMFVILFTVVVLVVFILRKLELKYDSYIAIGAGIVLGTGILIFGRMTFDVTFRIPVIVLNALGSAIVLVVIEFMHGVMDYEAVQKLVFEDDDYEYHVTLIPKIGVQKELYEDELLPYEEDEPEPEPAPHSMEPERNTGRGISQEHGRSDHGNRGQDDPEAGRETMERPRSQSPHSQSRQDVRPSHEQIRQQARQQAQSHTDSQRYQNAQHDSESHRRSSDHRYDTDSRHREDRRQDTDSQHRADRRQNTDSQHREDQRQDTDSRRYDQPQHSAYHQSTKYQPSPRPASTTGRRPRQDAQDEEDASYRSKRRSEGQTDHSQHTDQNQDEFMDSFFE